MAPPKKYFNKGFIILSKGERIAVINLLIIIVILLGFSLFRPMMTFSGKDRIAFHRLDSLLAVRKAADLNPPPSAEKASTETGTRSKVSRSRASPAKETTVAQVTPIPKKVIEPIELNSTDSIALVTLPQIGEVMASRIHRYRERLGGFVAVEQLFEIKGMDSTRFETIQPYLLLNNQEIKKINVNQDAFKTLLRHPYLEYEQVKAIVNYRERRGFIQDWNQLCDIIGEVNPLLQRYVTY